MNWRDKAALQAEQDQDMANAAQWWQEAPAADKRALWDQIQMHHASPMAELITRFAQIGFTQIALAALDEQKEPPK